jgi:site-specific DNA-cytosine methylase
VVLLFPTPTRSDGTGGPGTSPNRKGGMNLRTLVTTLPESVDLVQDWADFEPAIRRQEALSWREAPIPTELGPRGGRRLAARFAEWLMWIPDGHVTAVPGLTRSEQLQRIGNGVVPIQALTGYEHLMHLMNKIKEEAA